MTAPPSLSQVLSFSQISSLRTRNTVLVKTRLITIACELIIRDYDGRVAFLRDTLDINRTQHVCTSAKYTRYYVYVINN